MIGTQMPASVGTKIQVCEDGRILVTETGEHMALLADDWKEVLQKVDSYLSNRVAPAAAVGTDSWKSHEMK